MFRKLKYIIAIFSLLLFVQPVLAFDTNALVKFDAPYATIYGGTFNHLALDFTLVMIRPDIVRAISLKNLGSADYLKHIKTMKLWADSGEPGFQGFGIDREVGNLSYYKTYDTWSLADLSVRITDSQRFFISLEAYSNISGDGTVKMQIPRLLDNNGDSSFDLGDAGIFMDSGNNGPANNAITNTNLQVFSTTIKDSFGPIAVFSNLADSQTINNDSLWIKGVVRDQGNAGLKDLVIIIDSQAEPATNLGADFSWSYYWQNISDGNHTLKLLAADLNGNISQDNEITVNVLKQNINLGNSAVLSDKIIITDTGINAANIIVTLRDEFTQPVAGRQVWVNTSPGLYLNWLADRPDYDFSDINGQVKFQVASTQIGLKNLYIWVDEQKIGQLEINVLPESLLEIGLISGDLIKASSSAVYYYACNGTRQAFFNESVYFSWFSDFSQVRTITDEQLASLPLGPNVTYRPGKKLIKIQTDPKVYAIDKDSTLRWVISENLAKSLYGLDWTAKVADLTPAFFTNYKVGENIEATQDYYPQNVSAASVKIDQNLCQPL